MTRKVNKPLIFIMSAVLALATIAGVVGATWALNTDPYSWTATAPEGKYETRILTYGTSTGTFPVTVDGTRNAVTSDNTKMSVKFDNAKTGSMTFTALEKPGLVSAIIANRAGMIRNYECLVKNNTKYIETYKFQKKYEEIKANATFDINSKLSNVTDTQKTGIVWTSLDTTIATVSGTTVRGVAQGITELDGSFTDCYGQAQKMVFTVAVDCKIDGTGATITVTRPITEIPGATAGDILRPVGTPAHVYEVVDENGKSHYPPVYVYDKNMNGDPNDGDLVPAVSGTDGYYIESPANIFNKLNPSTGATTTDSPVWGGEDGKLGTSDDVNAKKFGDQYYADKGQNIFAPIQGAGSKELGALVGGGLDNSPATSPASPIVELDGKYYLAGQTDANGNKCMYGDSTSGGDKALNSQNGTLAATDQVFYFDATTGKPTTTAPAATGPSIEPTTADPTKASWTSASLVTGANIGDTPRLQGNPTIQDYNGTAVAASRITYEFQPATYTTSGSVPVTVIMKVDGTPVSASTLTTTVNAPTTAVNKATVDSSVATLAEAKIGDHPTLLTYPTIKYNDGTMVPDSEKAFSYKPGTYTAAGDNVAVTVTMYVSGQKIGDYNMSAKVTDPNAGSGSGSGVQIGGGTISVGNLTIGELPEEGTVTSLWGKGYCFQSDGYMWRILGVDSNGYFLITTTEATANATATISRDENNRPIYADRNYYSLAQFNEETETYTNKSSVFGYFTRYTGSTLETAVNSISSSLTEFKELAIDIPYGYVDDNSQNATAADINSNRYGCFALSRGEVALMGTDAAGRYSNGNASNWWTRTTIYQSSNNAYLVNTAGVTQVITGTWSGGWNYTLNSGLGVRPAMWIDLGLASAE